MAGFTSEQLRLSGGVSVERDFVFEQGLVITPRLGVDVGAAALDRAGLFGTLTGGLTLSNGSAWSLSTNTLLNVSAQDRYTLGARLSILGHF